MLSSGHLRSTLADLDSLYGDPGISSLRQKYYAKLALIEFCGWIEECLDEMARQHCSSMSNMNELEEILKKVHGFSYRNLRSILVQIVGIVNVVEIENNLRQNSASYNILNSQLNTLSFKRNNAAHTHISGVQVIYDAPTGIVAELNQIEPALIELEAELIARLP